jgi:1-phosphofructokinase family hexose kinase
LTPAWQQVLVFRSFCPGEVNRADASHWCASGKVFNAAVGAHQLGGPSLALAMVGGPPVAEIERQFDAIGLRYRWVKTASATRVCTTIIDQSTGAMTELVENGRPVSMDELEQFRKAFAEESLRSDVAILIGSLPAGAPDAFYRDVLDAARCPAILDFRGPGLLATLDLKPFVVKPNRAELAQTLGDDLESDGDLRDAMQSLNRRGARWVVVTQGAGPVWVTSANAAYRVYPLPVERREVVNPLGCGDVMSAAIAWATRAGWEFLDAMRLGMAAADANLRSLLPGRFDPAGVAERATMVRVEAA